MGVLGVDFYCGALTVDVSDLRASMDGQDLPEAAKERFLSMHENSVVLKEQLKTTQEKLTKARAVGLLSWHR